MDSATNLAVLPATVDRYRTAFTETLADTTPGAVPNSVVDAITSDKCDDHESTIRRNFIHCLPRQINGTVFLEFTDVLPVAFNVLFTLSIGLVFYGPLLEQLNVASLSRPTVFLQCYALLLL